MKRFTYTMQVEVEITPEGSSAEWHGTKISAQTENPALVWYQNGKWTQEGTNAGIFALCTGIDTLIRAAREDWSANDAQLLRQAISQLETHFVENHILEHGVDH